MPKLADGKTRLIVVGPSPTYGDLDAGVCGDSTQGRYVKRMLGGINVAEGDIHYTNAILCKVKPKEWAKARRCCAQRLRDELAELDADAPVLTTHRIATQTLLGLSKPPPPKLGYRGAVCEPDDPSRGFTNVPRTVLQTVDTFIVSRDQRYEVIFETDILRLQRVLEGTYTPPEDTGRIAIAKSYATLRYLLKQLDEYVAVDVETVGIDPHTVPMTCLVISDQLLSVVIPWSRNLDGTIPYFSDMSAVIQLINKTLDRRVSVTHNGPNFDHIVLRQHGIHVNRWDDTMLMYHVNTSHFPKRLNHLVSCYLDAPPWKAWDHGQSLQTLWEYCGRDGLYTIRVYHRLKNELDVDDWSVYQSDTHSAELCRTMSLNGYRFDRNRALSTITALKQREQALTKQIAELVDVPEINPNSTQQIASVILGKLGAPVIERSKTGAPSMNVNSLRAYVSMGDDTLAEFCNLVLEWRRVHKCAATYIGGVKPHADGLVRPTWKSTGTISGRWSSSKPNLANLPRMSNDPSAKIVDGGIRSLYIASRADRRILAFDLGQAEFRIAAYTTGDEEMIRVCEGSDIHSRNAELLFGDKFRNADSKTRKTLRSCAKMAGFAVCYSAEAPTVHAQLIAAGVSVTLMAVEAMIRKLRTSFQQYYTWQAENLERTMVRGYVESPILKRKRWLGHSPRGPENTNYPIQSGAADVMNTKLYQIVQCTYAAQLDAKLVAMVYDSAMFDVHERDVPALYEIITHEFEKPIDIGGREFIMPIDFAFGMRWSDNWQDAADAVQRGLQALCPI